MMNGYLVHEEAQFLATRVAREAGAGRPAQLKRAFEIVLNRDPSSDETKRFSQYSGGLDSICRVLLNSNEFLYVE
jgi:hypothetical protein